MEIYTLVHRPTLAARKAMVFSPTPGNPCKKCLFPKISLGNSPFRILDTLTAFRKYDWKFTSGSLTKSDHIEF